MSEKSNSDSEADSDEYEQWELETLSHVPSLPQEIQSHIASFCDQQSLAALRRVNREWNKKVFPFLWQDLDFLEYFQEDGLLEAVRLFFVLCDEMIDSDPARFETLASHVRTLDLGRVIGINIVKDVENEYFDWFDCDPDPDTDERRRTMFDIIAHFKNLESLSICVKNWWPFGSNRESAGRALQSHLAKLKSLKVGGQIPPKVLQGLIQIPGLKDVSLISLNKSPGQDHGPEAITVLTEEMCQNLTSLETLHLCKLADLHPGNNEDWDNEADDEPEYASGMTWPFPRESEGELLQEWAMLLKHTSKTLRELTIENRYLCSWGWEHCDDAFITPGDKHPEDYGAHSIRESQRVLFPVLFRQEWPKLERLTLVGMGTEADVERDVAHLRGRVTIEQRPARFQIMMGDVTPEEISTPVEFADFEPDYELAEDYLRRQRE